MITYKFGTDIRRSNNQEVPVIMVDEKSIKGSTEYMFLTEELNNLSGEGIRVIVKHLEEVISGEREREMFGFETTMIWCYSRGKSYYGEKYPDSEVTITYDYADEYIVTDLKVEDIFQMMKDWKNYIDEWEKDTGLTKK